MRILYLVTEDWYFVSHRLPMACAARDAGFEVHVATRVRAHGEAIQAQGFQLHALDWVRGSTGVLGNIAAVRQIRALLRTIDPVILHNIAMKPTLLGGLAASGRSGMSVVNSATGLGSVMMERPGWRALPGTGLRQMIGHLCRRANAAVIVQNPDDAAAFRALGVRDAVLATNLDADGGTARGATGKASGHSPHGLTLIPGSGVDTDHFAPLPEPDHPITAAFVGRMLRDKGVETAVEAHRILRRRGAAVRLILAGTPDPENPTSLSEAQVAGWADEAGIEWRGHVTDVREVWRDAHIALLPSLREGLPKSLLEASACARPMIATDVPGCRDVVRAGETGLLHAVGDAERLADHWQTLAGDQRTRRAMATAARRRAEDVYSSQAIGAQTVALYRQLVDT